MADVLPSSPLLLLIPTTLLLASIAGWSLLTRSRTPQVDATSNVHDLSKEPNKWVNGKDITLFPHIVDTTLNGFTYRILHLKHPLSQSVSRDKLQKTYNVPPIPYLVIVHGLGGSFHQFSDLIHLFRDVSNIFSVDWVPVDFDPKRPGADNLLDLRNIASTISTLMQQLVPAKDHTSPLPVSIICHSMGTAIGTFLYSSLSSVAYLNIASLIYLNPKAALGPADINQIKTLQKLPDTVINIVRRFERMGGINSVSVKRFLGSEALQNEEVRRLQLTWNSQSRTDVLRCISKCLLRNGWATDKDYAKVNCRILIIGGLHDKVTNVENLKALRDMLSRSCTTQNTSKSAVTKPSPEPPIVIPNMGHQCMTEFPELVHALLSHFWATKCADLGMAIVTLDNQLNLKRCMEVLSENEGSDDRKAEKVKKEGIQEGNIQEMSDGGQNKKKKEKGSKKKHLENVDGDNEKWSLKNYKKWLATPPISPRLTPSYFRAMKTLRQFDPDHSPVTLYQQHTSIGLVVDISAQEPPYDTRLENLGIDIDDGVTTDKKRMLRYTKVSTKSKVPPGNEEVKLFIETCQAFWKQHPSLEIAVHCHYGFNRTGFMICCYLIEVCKLSVKEAIRCFAEKRDGGIRHLHFRDELYLRYHPREVML